MTQEDKELLLKDLCARLPYNTVCLLRPLTNNSPYNGVLSGELLDDLKKKNWGDIKPYLHSMSSMTEEEVNEYNQYWEKDRDDIMIVGKHFEEMYKSKKFTLYMHPVVPMYRHILWLLENHFDFMGLIPKGLAIEVTKENNPYK